MKPSNWTAEDVRRINWLIAGALGRRQVPGSLQPEREKLVGEYGIHIDVEPRAYEMNATQWDLALDLLDDWRMAKREGASTDVAEEFLNHDFGITISYAGDKHES